MAVTKKDKTLFVLLALVAVIAAAARKAAAGNVLPLGDFSQPGD